MERLLHAQRPSDLFWFPYSRKCRFVISVGFLSPWVAYIKLSVIYTENYAVTGVLVRSKPLSSRQNHGLCKYHIMPRPSDNVFSSDILFPPMLLLILVHEPGILAAGSLPTGDTFEKNITSHSLLSLLTSMILEPACSACSPTAGRPLFQQH